MMYRISKRLFDIVCAVLGIIGTFPLWIIAMAGILVSDWGPVFYVGVRVGKDNREFRMYKFRSMRVLKGPAEGAEASLRAEEERIFPFGRFIRRMKIDELPQLLNVLGGTMSVIGPRPVARDQFGMFRYGKWDEARKVPVGMSGPAALYDFICGDRITDEAEYLEKVYPVRRELEYTYVQKAGVLYDFKMMVYTVICILYAAVGRECAWILEELEADAAGSMDKRN